MSVVVIMSEQISFEESVSILPSFFFRFHSAHGTMYAVWVHVNNDKNAFIIHVSDFLELWYRLFVFVFLTIGEKKLILIK